MILVGYVASGCSSSKSEKTKNDSIAAAELEAARLDSIRQDSINRRNFTTPDLAFHDLHGDVKMCEIDLNHCYTYDESGNWTNTPTWSDYAKKNYPEKVKKDMVVRDDKGQIIRIYCDSDCDYEYDSFEWVDGKLAVGEGVKFNDLGFPIYSEIEGFDGKDRSYQFVYYDYIIDDKGNWIERKRKYKSFDPNYPNDLFFDTVTETRKITYYKNYGEKTTKIANTPEQFSMLNAFAGEESKRIEAQARLEAEGYNNSYSNYAEPEYHDRTSANHKIESPSFRIPADVYIYLSDKIFRGENLDGDKLSIKIKTDCVYANGASITAAPRVSNVSPTTAVIKASSAYTGGGDIIFYLDAQNGTLTLQSGEKLYLSN